MLRVRDGELEMLGESINSMSRAIRERISMLSTVLNSVPQSIFWKDGKGRFLGCNAIFAKAIGFDRPESVVGKTDFDLFPEEDANGYFSDEQQVMETALALAAIPQVRIFRAGIWKPRTRPGAFEGVG